MASEAAKMTKTVCGFNSPRPHHLDSQDSVTQIVSPATYTGIKRNVGVESAP
jgi:hypothetical protein